MAEEWVAHIVLTLDTERPIEIDDFVSAFTAIAGQYRKFVRTNYPDIMPEADIYVTEVRPGSIVADLIAWATSTLAPVGEHLQKQAVEQFVKYMGTRISAYFSPGGRDPQASRSDLSDLMNPIDFIDIRLNRAG